MFILVEDTHLLYLDILRAIYYSAENGGYYRKKVTYRRIIVILGCMAEALQLRMMYIPLQSII